MMTPMLTVTLTMHLTMTNETHIFPDKTVLDSGRILRNEENNWIAGDVTTDLLYKQSHEIHFL